MYGCKDMIRIRILAKTALVVMTYNLQLLCVVCLLKAFTIS